MKSQLVNRLLRSILPSITILINDLIFDSISIRLSTLPMFLTNTELQTLRADLPSDSHWPNDDKSGEKDFIGFLKRTIFDAQITKS
jgi:hypothetical protein